jgi:hypothetical protein
MTDEIDFSSDEVVYDDDDTEPAGEWTKRLRAGR